MKATVIETPIGPKKVRSKDVSENGKFLFVHDVLSQQRWIAISTLQKIDEFIAAETTSGVRIALKATAFLRE
jgi:hypothetical protein